jgi:hypothetical protein
MTEATKTHSRPLALPSSCCQICCNLRLMATSVSGDRARSLARAAALDRPMLLRVRLDPLIQMRQNLCQKKLRSFVS